MAIPIPAKVYNFFKYLILPSFLLIFFSLPITIFYGPVVIYGHPLTPWLIFFFLFWLTVFITVNFRPSNGKSAGVYSGGRFFRFFFLTIVLFGLLIGLGYGIVYLPLTSRLLADARYTEPFRITFEARESDRLYYEIEGRQTGFGATFNFTLVGPNSFATSTKMKIAEKSGSGSSMSTEVRFSKIKIPVDGLYTLLIVKESGSASISRMRVLAR